MAEIRAAMSKLPPAAPFPLSPRLRLVLRVAVLAMAAFSMAQHWLLRPFTMHGVDYTVVWRAFHNLALGGGVYQHPAVLIGPDHWEVFKYPQFTAFAFVWLGRVEGWAGEAVWKAVMVAALLATIPVLVLMRPRGAGTPAGRVLEGEWAATVVLLVAVFSPASWALSIGQVGPLLLLLAAWWIWANRAGREKQAGVAWALLCLVKVSPVLLVLPMLLWRRWRTLAAGGLVFACYGAILLATGRWRDELRYVTEIAPQIPFLARYVSSAPLQWVVKIADPAAMGDAAAYARYQHALTLAGLALYAAALSALRFRRCGWIESLPCGLLLITAISPVLEGHHFVLIYPALFLQAALWTEGRLATRWFAPTMAAWVPIIGAGWFLGAGYGLGHEFMPLTANLVLAGAAWAGAGFTSDRTR